jgi:RNase P subunit RPR2
MKRWKSPKIRVYCKNCEEWMEESLVNFVDICEDMYGRDLLSFDCPKCGEFNKSLRVG